MVHARKSVKDNYYRALQDSVNIGSSLHFSLTSADKSSLNFLLKF